MTAWWSGNLFVEIAFDNAPLTATASCTWVDVTTYVRGVSINRGRQTELSTYSPGTATVQLDNLTRLFDPSNTAGTYFGKLLPMKRIRVRASIGATSAVIFAGYVMGWPIAYPGMTDSVVSVNAVDGFRLLDQFTLPDSAYEYEVMADAPSYYWEMQGLDDGDNVVATAGGYDLPPDRRPTINGITYDYTEFTAVSGASAPYGATRALAAGRGYVPVPSLGGMKAVEAWVSSYAADALYGWQVMAASSSTTYMILNSASIVYSNAADNRTLSGGLSGTVIPGLQTMLEAAATSVHVAAYADTTNLYIYLNGTLVKTEALTVGTTSSTTVGNVSPGIVVHTSNVNNALSHVALYSTAPSGARILAHYNAGTIAYGHPTGEATGTRLGRVLTAMGWPTADRDISTGTTIVGKWLPQGASPLSAARHLEDTEQGLLFMDAAGNVAFRDRQWQMSNASAVTSTATFGDSGSEIPYADVTIDGNLVDYIRNAVSVSYNGGTVWAEDSTSQGAYGEQSDSVSATDLPTWGGFLARQLAAFRLRLRKDPATRVPSIQVAWRKNLSTYLPTRLNMELGERVTVKRRPTGGTGSFDLACTVQGIQDTIDAQNWTTTLYLSPAPKSYTEGPYLTMGDATYGKIGAVAGNLIPY